MEKNYTYSQLQVWQSARHVSQKICDLINYFPDEEIEDVVERIRTNAKSLPFQIAEELQEEESSKTFSTYIKSKNILEILEEELIHAFDQSCITERELKITLEAINIYSHQLKKHQSKTNDEHKLIAHLYKKTENSIA